jgi:uncharacterized hydrophobic protein (TIGR00271 family)
MEENLDEKQLDQKKETVQRDFKGFFKSIKEFLQELLDIRKDTDKEVTAITIKEGISMKGHTAWILVFSILVASIGLNVSSAAVVIGAMLISPLMGPILGIGYSIGINDIDTLRSSLVNFGVMVGLSVLTSFLFFSIPIFVNDTPELLARTQPDVRDVLIAVSGGLALIIAITRPRPQFNTVAGVAIATALMPPLCTAGYGLASGNFSYFGGAMFLFTINSIFIALAAFAIIRYLRFPMLKYINEAKRKRISQVAYLVALVIFSLSIYLFYELFIINQYKTKANQFITILKGEGVNVIGDPNESIDYENKQIKLYVFGSDYTDRDRVRWQKQMEDMGLSGTKLNILQSQDDSRLRDDIDNLKNLYVNSNRLISLKDETIQEKDLKISTLEKSLRKYQDNEIPFDAISKEIKINYENLENISFAREFVTNFEKIDTVSVISLKWKDGTRTKTKKEDQEKLEKWLAIRLHLKNIEVRTLP